MKTLIEIFCLLFFLDIIGSTEKLLLKAKLLSTSVLMTLIIRGILTWDPVGGSCRCSA
jgi:hypothetical protein